MADLPILFSAPMVRAILREIEQPGTGKTQTRRTFHHKKNLPSGGAWHQPFPDAVPNGWVYADRKRAFDTMRSRYCVGDRLYVREAWRAEADFDEVAPRDMFEDTPIAYEASPSFAHIAMGSFRQGMHMPRWASRITLIVTEVRVQRLQDISEGDAVAEGIEHVTTTSSGRFYQNFDNPGCPILPVGSCRSLWNSINAERAPWESNPWVAAYTFLPILGNIDQIEVK